jgi:hypothetical protein
VATRSTGEAKMDRATVKLILGKIFHLAIKMTMYLCITKKEEISSGVKFVSLN